MAVRGGKRGGGSRVGAMLVLVGLAGVLGGTFGLGFLAGRHWPRVQVMVGFAKPTVQAHTVDLPSGSASSGAKPHGAEATGAREPAAPRGGTRADETARGDSASRPDVAGTAESGSGAPANEPPRLTFYQELTAPLASLPRERAVAGPDRASDHRTKGADALGLPRPQRSEAPGGTRGAPRAPSSGEQGARGDGAGERFTIQVAAYGTPSQAETLRGRLAAKGLEAAVSEVATSSGTRWRVRVGTYASRDDARAAADRLATQIGVDPMVVRDTRDGGR